MTVQTVGNTTDGQHWVSETVFVCVGERAREERKREREKTDKQRVEEKLCILILNRHELELPFLTIPRPLKCQSFPLHIYIYDASLSEILFYTLTPLLPFDGYQ